MNFKRLFVFEGRKTEFDIVKNLFDSFFEFSDEETAKCAYCTDIYTLCNKTLKGEDIFLHLKRMESNKEILKNYNRDDFGEIYLFFDYEGHAPTADNEKLLEIINFFDNETEAGKVFISYPMVEALKHFSNSIDFKKLTFEIKEGKSYKGIVNEESDSQFRQFKKYNKEIRAKLIEVHLKKMNFIVNNHFSIPNVIIPQNEVFTKQVEKHINIDATVAVLSAFPVFIFDYYGYDFVNELIKENKK